MKKLKIPAPGQELEETGSLADELLLSIVLCFLLIFFGTYFWILPQLNPPPPDPIANIADPEERHEAASVQRFEEIAASGRIDRIQWTPEERLDAFAFAPRPVTEAACHALNEHLTEGSLSSAESQALADLVERRTERAPWHCLLRLYLDDSLSDGPLNTALADFWLDIEDFRFGALMRPVIETFRTERSRPETERFFRWLRRCAMNPDYRAASECQRLARQLSPELGDDLLEMVLLHLEAPDLAPSEILEAATALVHLARSGQPDAWRIDETRALPDYNVDLRFGALFATCRLLNTPDRDLHAPLARIIGHVAGIGARPNNPHLPYRWRRACRMAFGDPHQEELHIPILSVLAEHPETGETIVDYSLNILFDFQLCEEEEGMPRWFCGSDAWTGSSEDLSRVMGYNFGLTAYVEWMSPEELAELTPRIDEHISEQPDPQVDKPIHEDPDQQVDETVNEDPDQQVDETVNEDPDQQVDEPIDEHANVRPDESGNEQIDESVNEQPEPDPTTP